MTLEMIHKSIQNAVRGTITETDKIKEFILEISKFSIYSFVNSYVEKLTAEIFQDEYDNYDKLEFVLEFQHHLLLNGITSNMIMETLLVPELELISHIPFDSRVKEIIRGDVSNKNKVIPILYLIRLHARYFLSQLESISVRNRENEQFIVK